MTADRARLREIAVQTLNGSTGDDPWLPYEESWKPLADGVLTLLDALDEAEKALRPIKAGADRIIAGAGEPFAEALTIANVAREALARMGEK